jgi:hypothetical protein
MIENMISVPNIVIRTRNISMQAIDDKCSFEKSLKKSDPITIPIPISII